MRRAAVVFPVAGSPTVRNSVGCLIVPSCPGELLVIVDSLVAAAAVRHDPDRHDQALHRATRGGPAAGPRELRSRRPCRRAGDVGCVHRAPDPGGATGFRSAAARPPGRRGSLLRLGRHLPDDVETAGLCAPGSFVYVPPNVAHTFVVVSEEPGKKLNLFSPAAMVGFFEALAEAEANGTARPNASVRSARHTTWRSPVRCPRPTSELALPRARARAAPHPRLRGRDPRLAGGDPRRHRRGR